MIPLAGAAGIAIRVVGRMGRAGIDIIRLARARAAEKPIINQTPKDILNPNGQPLGRPGKRPEVRIEKGGDKAARNLYERLKQGGKPDTPSNYPGEGTRLSNGDWVGYRPMSKSGSATVDIHIKDVGYDKIHFLE